MEVGMQENNAVMQEVLWTLRGGGCKHVDHDESPKPHTSAENKPASSSEPAFSHDAYTVTGPDNVETGTSCQKGSIDLAPGSCSDTQINVNFEGKEVGAWAREPG